jgi:iron-sulfur cluster repair protein YtfE (RIC family)
VKVTEAIALEHATLLKVFDEVERILPGLGSAAEAVRLATMVERLLGTHAELETDFAFVALDHVLRDEGHLATLHQEHRELDGRLRRVHEATSCEEACGLLRAGLGDARTHFLREERELFPVLERALGQGALVILGEAFTKATQRKAGWGGRAGISR